MFGYIYITENKINGRLYIGQKTGNFIEIYKGSGVALKNAFKKYGKENFSVKLQEYADDRKSLNELERDYIKKYNATGNGKYYNLCSGGDSWGSPHTQETREKIRQAALGRPSPMKGKPNKSASKRMLENNPMKNPIIAKKVADKNRGKSSGNKIHNTFINECEWCKKGKEMRNTAKNRTKRFCNKSCAASYSNTHRN